MFFILLAGDDQQHSRDDEAFLNMSGISDDTMSAEQDSQMTDTSTLESPHQGTHHRNWCFKSSVVHSMKALPKPWKFS